MRRSPSHLWRFTDDSSYSAPAAAPGDQFTERQGMAAGPDVSSAAGASEGTTGSGQTTEAAETEAETAEAGTDTGAGVKEVAAEPQTTVKLEAAAEEPSVEAGSGTSVEPTSAVEPAAGRDVLLAEATIKVETKSEKTASAATQDSDSASPLKSTSSVTQTALSSADHDGSVAKASSSSVDSSPNAASNPDTDPASEPVTKAAAGRDGGMPGEDSTETVEEALERLIGGNAEKTGGSDAQKNEVSRGR